MGFKFQLMFIEINRAEGFTDLFLNAPKWIFHLSNKILIKIEKIFVNSFLHDLSKQAINKCEDALFKEAGNITKALKIANLTQDDAHVMQTLITLLRILCSVNAEDA
jgi:hypothetical protein